MANFCREYTAAANWINTCSLDTYEYNENTSNTLKANAFMKFNIGTSGEDEGRLIV